MAPPGVTLALTTLMVARHSAESGEAQESWNHAVRATREMARAKVDIIVFGGGPVVYSGGHQRAHDTMQALQQEFGIPVTNSTTAYHQADAALGARVVGSVTYARPREAPNTCPTSVSPTRTRHTGGPEVRRGAVHRGGRHPLRSAVAARPGAQAGTPRDRHPPPGLPHWATGAVIETLEQELGVNVVQGSQAILWWALRTLGIDDRIEGYGRLLREH